MLPSARDLGSVREQLMPLVLFYTKRVREALKAPTGLVADLVFLLFAGSIIGLLVMMGRRVSTPYTPTTVISLSLWVLPKYTLMSLSRGFAAYFLSLIFTLVYGTIAAHNRRAEKVMVPALDVLQAIPVLGFLPGLVLAMVRLFPTSELGLELACVIMIFTAQVWNMTFSFHGSLRGIPQPLREVAAIQRLSGWKTFRLLEVPAAMIGLVWNSMMSMAGGWFFLTVNEAFTLGKNDYRLPGIGS
ncbi:MAG: transporter, inner rane subunit, partial [Phycisphaerales bacterium]|nr:transporter, inner rane subunit [Phycisphaerales bacterium]